MGYGVRGNAEARETGQLVDYWERLGSGEVGPGSRETRVARQSRREAGGKWMGYSCRLRGRWDRGNGGH